MMYDDFDYWVTYLPRKTDKYYCRRCEQIFENKTQAKSTTYGESEVLVCPSCDEIIRGFSDDK